MLGCLMVKSCEKTEEISPLVVSSSYNASAYEANTVAEKQLIVTYTDFVNEIKKGRVAGTVLSAATIKAIFEKNGSNSISTRIPAGIQSNMLTFLTEIEKASKGTGYTFGLLPAQNGNGGVNNGYLFDETGLELEQMLDKTLFGSLFYTQAATLLTQPTQANLDKALILFGANPTFPNTSSASKTAQPDILIANYGARRTKAAGGLYTEVRVAFIKAQSAILAGDKYNKERDAAIAIILLKWEEINAATVINYLYDVETKLGITNVDNATKASAMHAYSECVGFLTGFKWIPLNIKISDNQIDELLVKMNAASPYKLIGSPTEIAKIVDARNDLKKIYGFSDQQMLDFKNNWLTVEGR